MKIGQRVRISELLARLGSENIGELQKMAVRVRHQAKISPHVTPIVGRFHQAAFLLGLGADFLYGFQVTQSEG
jgi:hypothetical protein